MNGQKGQKGHIPIIRTDMLGNIPLEGFKEPIVIKMGKVTKVIRGNSEIVYFGKKEHTKKPYILINGKLFEVF